MIPVRNPPPGTRRAVQLSLMAELDAGAYPDLPRSPDPHRCDGMEPGTPEWARRGSLGHLCEACGFPCGTTDCHVRCCGTELSNRHVEGSYCTGHPCPGCSAVDDLDEDWAEDDDEPIHLPAGRRVETVTVAGGVL